MELDDLKQAVWNLDRRLEQVRTLNVQESKERNLDRTRASLRPLVWGHAGQVALGIVLALAVGPFWVNRLSETPLLIAGVLVHAYAILMIVLGARVLALVRGLDFAAPVLEIQKQLARLRRSYVTTGLVVGLPWWLLWIPLFMVISGIDLYAPASRAWLVTSVIVGVVGILGTLWFCRGVWRRTPDSGQPNRTEGALASMSLRNAQRFLDDIARFEREE